MWIRYLLLALLVCSNAAISSEKEENIMSEVIWIDVRTEEEYAQGFYKDAMLIPYDTIHDKIHTVTDDKSADIRVYCRSGRRSGVARDILVKMGYTNVTNEGGYEDLLKQDN